MVKKLIVASKEGKFPRPKGSCRFPLIVFQQTTQSFLAPHNSALPARPSIRQWEQEPVLLALVITLLVVMGHVLLQRSAQRSLPEQDELRQAFLFHRSHPAFPYGKKTHLRFRGREVYPTEGSCRFPLMVLQQT